MQPTPSLRLYHYWRSSSSWRVRWAFALKRIECEKVPVSLLDGESEGPEHRARNPLGYVPVLEFLGEQGSIRYLGESMAIIHWAEEIKPEPRLLPQDPLLRARARQLAEIINADTQPLQNPNVAALHSTDESERKRWSQHWIRAGLSAYEKLASETAGTYSIGNEITLPDLFLVPQLYNAARFDIPASEFPLLERIRDAALETAACKASHPSAYEPKEK